MQGSGKGETSSLFRRRGKKGPGNPPSLERVLQQSLSMQSEKEIVITSSSFLPYLFKHASRGEVEGGWGVLSPEERKEEKVEVE